MAFPLTPEQLKNLVDETVAAIFASMLHTEIRPSRSGNFLPEGELQVIGMVGLTGHLKGVVCLRFGEKLSRLAARSMLHLTPDKDPTPLDINDVVGELTNILTGKLGTSLCSEKEGLDLSLPTIIRGQRIDLETISGVERSSFTFNFQDHPLVLEIYAIKNPEKCQPQRIPKILLVDDSKATRAFIAKMFVPYHCEILEAHNGAQGWATAQEKLPSAIVLDMTMPIMNGVELLKLLKSHEATKDILVIMLTANSHPEEIARIKALGATHYVTKTEKPIIILEIILKHLRLETKTITAYL